MNKIKKSEIIYSIKINRNCNKTNESPIQIIAILRPQQPLIFNKPF